MKTTIEGGTKQRVEMEEEEERKKRERGEGG